MIQIHTFPTVIIHMQTLTPLQSVAVSEGVGVWHSRRQFPCRHGYEMLIPMSLPMSMQTRMHPRHRR